MIRLILEADYDPQFSDHSHGFRPGRGCHTALKEIDRTWQGTTWFIEGDIKGCFDHLDHEVLLDILREDIHDGRFISLIKGLLNAGYLEDWGYHRTLSGTPQGGVVSPILANIYLDRLDQWVETTLIPDNTRGTRRKTNPMHARLTRQSRRLRTKGRGREAHRLRQQRRTLPSHDPNDPDYRRLRYIRYADDFLLGFAGPRVEAEDIKRRLGEFLRDHLKLDLSADKTLITHGRSAAARFLGYDLVVLHNDRRRTVNGQIGLKLPTRVVREKGAAYEARGGPKPRPERTHDTVFSIVVPYGSEFRGIAGYYRMAYNLRRLERLRWVMGSSLARTLAAKQRIRVAQVYRRYRTTVPTVRGPRRVLRVTVDRAGQRPLVATWGQTNLVQDTNATLRDDPIVWRNTTRTEIEQRLLADTCELCGSRDGVQVHHIKALRNLHRPGRHPKPAWVTTMVARQRKTLIVCRDCHTAIHAGRPTRAPTSSTEDWKAG